MEEQRSPVITMVPRAHAAGHNTTRFLLRRSRRLLGRSGTRRSQWEIIAAITDDREDGPLRRMHQDIGNKYIVPPNIIIKKDVNPTGHAIIFLGTSSIFGLRSEPRPVLCYVMNGEV